MRPSLVLSEIGIGLRRNLTMTLAVIVTTAVSLALLGGALIIKHQVDTMHDIYGSDTTVQLYLAKDVTQQQRQSIQADLTADTAHVTSVTYRSQQDNLTIFRKEFADQPELVNNTTADQLPESFVVTVKHAPQDVDAIVAAYTGRPGVENIGTLREAIQKLFTILDGLRNAAIGVAIVQVLAALLLIGNTIRVAAFNRRRETSIMRLVGASSVSIRLPFLLEGAVAGLLGALAACGALALGKRFLADSVLKSLFSNVIPNIAWRDVLQTMPVLLGVGVVIAALASAVSLTRYLRV